jgi:hypothetical protein
MANKKIHNGKEGDMVLNSRIIQLRLSPVLMGHLEAEAARRGLRPTEMLRVAISETCQDARGEYREESNRGKAANVR